MLQLQRIQSAILRAPPPFINLRVPLTQRNNLDAIVKRQKLPNPPHATPTPLFPRCPPFPPHLPQPRRLKPALIRSVNLEQITTSRTHVHPFVEIEFTPTFRINAALQNPTHNCSRLEYYYTSLGVGDSSVSLDLYY